MKPSRTMNEPRAANPRSPAPRSAAPCAGRERTLLRHPAARREAAAARRYAGAERFRPGSLPRGSGEGAARRAGARPGRPGFAAAATAAVVAAAGAVLGALALLAAMPEARAAASWYQVEVAIFGQGGESAWEQGYWRPADGPPPVAENTVELLAGLPPSGEASDASRSRQAFRRLPDSTLELRQAMERLERSDEYRVLLHAAWRQPEARGRQAPGVRLSTLRGAAADGRFARRSGGETAVEGTIRLRRQRFLYVDADLAFGNLEARPADDPTAPARAGTALGNAAPAQGAAPRTGGEKERPRAARLTRTLRVRLGRLQYVDHPLFGVLLLVRRLP